MGNAFLDFLDKEAPWIMIGIILPLILIPREMHGIALGIAGATFLGLPQLLLWLIQMKIFVTAQRPEIPKDGPASEETVVLCGDSITAGYGASGPQAALFSHCIQAGHPVIVRAAPFQGATALLKLVYEIPTPEGKRYRAVIVMIGGNDVIPIIGGSLRSIRRAFNSILDRAIVLGKNVVILTNFEGLGELYPVWWLRIIFRIRARKIRRTFEEIVRESILLKQMMVVDIAPIITSIGCQAADNVHPNDTAYATIWRAAGPYI